MANITLNTGATSITIAGPKYPDEPGESAPVVVGRTMGGGIKVANLGSGTDFESPKLQFREMSNADYETLRNFIQDTCTWSVTPFTYTDPYSGSHTNMHYISGLPEFRRIRGKWNGTIELAKNMSA